MILHKNIGCFKTNFWYKCFVFRNKRYLCVALKQVDKLNLVDVMRQLLRLTWLCLRIWFDYLTGAFKNSTLVTGVCTCNNELNVFEGKIYLRQSYQILLSIFSAILLLLSSFIWSSHSLDACSDITHIPKVKHATRDDAT